MATELKPLGQRNPAAATLETLYTVPGATQAVGSSLMVCNRSNIASRFRIAVRPAGAGISDEMYIYFDALIPGNETFHATIGFALAATDVVSVYASLPTLSFTLFGQELT